jgi:hypothetical protein
MHVDFRYTTPIAKNAECPRKFAMMLEKEILGRPSPELNGCSGVAFVAKPKHVLSFINVYVRRKRQQVREYVQENFILECFHIMRTFFGICFDSSTHRDYIPLSKIELHQPRQQTDKRLAP